MVGTIEKFLEWKSQEDPEMSDLDKEMIGPPVRLECPMVDKHRMRKWADLLSGYAAKVQKTTRDPNMTDRQMAIELAFEGRLLTVRIKELYPELYEKRRRRVR